MARKDRQPLTVAPPPASSSSEEDDSDSDSDSGESGSSSDEQTNSQTQQPQQQPPNKSDSDSDTGSDSESDSGSDSDDKPTPSDNPKSKSTLPDNPKSKPTPLPTPTVTSTKRKNTDAEASNKVPSPKKAKKDVKSDPSGSTSVAGDGSKKPFQRVFGEEDEMAILQGLIDFKAKKGKDPMSNVDGFVEFVKKSLHVADVKKEQIVNKIRALKRRYQTAKKRNPTNPRDLLAFELSKTIWGESDGVDETPKSKVSNAKSKGIVKNDSAANGGVKVEEGGKLKKLGKVDVGKLREYGDVDEEFMKERLNLVGEDERKALEDEWFKFNVSQLKGLVNKLELYHKTAKCLLNAVKSSKK